MKREIHYISISEARIWYGRDELELERAACLQWIADGKNHCKIYSGISDHSIVRLAKIQEQMANRK